MTIPEEQKLTTYFEASARKFKTSEVVKYNTAGDGKGSVASIKRSQFHL